MEKNQTNATNVTLHLCISQKWHIESIESLENSNIIYSGGSVDVNLIYCLCDRTGDNIFVSVNENGRKKEIVLLFCLSAIWTKTISNFDKYI